MAARVEHEKAFKMRLPPAARRGVCPLNQRIFIYLKTKRAKEERERERGKLFKNVPAHLFFLFFDEIDTHRDKEATCPRPSTTTCL